MMHVAANAPRRSDEANLFHEMREGLDYVSAFVPIRTILMLVRRRQPRRHAFLVLHADLRRQVFHGGAHTLGFLMGAMGVGALISALSLAARRTVLGLGRMIGSPPHSSASACSASASRTTSGSRC